MEGVSTEGLELIVIVRNASFLVHFLKAEGNVLCFNVRVTDSDSAFSLSFARWAIFSPRTVIVYQESRSEMSEKVCAISYSEVCSLA